MESEAAERSSVLVLRMQGVYYLVTGVWPLVHMGSYLAVTGYKHDLWLVRTVGLLITVCALSLLVAARARRVTAEIVILASGFALSMAAVDVACVSQSVIPRIYLADAVAEVALAIALLLSRRLGAS